MSKILLTAQALKKLKEELNYLKNVRRKEVAEKIRVAKEQGDLSENAEYIEAKEDQAFLEGKINEMEYKIKTSEIVESKQDDKVGLDCAVKIVDKNGKEQILTIVSFNEANPIDGKISNLSPLAVALLGRKKGDEVEVELPKGVKTFKILEIKR